MNKFFSTSFKLIAGFISLLVVALVLAVIFGVTVDLSFLKPGIEKAAKNTLNREVKINGPVVFEFSNWTAIDVRDVHIENVQNAIEPDFFTGFDIWIITFTVAPQGFLAVDHRPA